MAGLVSAHGRCLDKMRQFQADAARPHRPPERLEEFMMEVVGHLCRVRVDGDEGVGVSFRV